MSCKTLCQNKKLWIVLAVVGLLLLIGGLVAYFVIVSRLGPNVDGANNLAPVRGAAVAVALGESGVRITNATTAGPTTLATTSLVVGDETYEPHDVSVAGSLLFALDGKEGDLTVWRIPADLTQPVTHVSGPKKVDVGPYSGVSAAGGRVVVSGGTGDLTLMWYDEATGVLSDASATMDVGQGQPDVVLNWNGTIAYVSTHIDGEDFGVTTLGLGVSGDASPLTKVSQLKISGAGFYPGVARPANFPLHIAVVDRETLAVTAGQDLVFVSVANPAAMAELRRVKVTVWGVGACADAAADLAWTVGTKDTPQLVATTVGTGSATPTVVKTTNLGDDALGLACAAVPASRVVVVATNMATVQVFPYPA